MSKESIATQPSSGLLTSVRASYLEFEEKLNTVWHKRALQIFLAIVLAHWAEHLVQAYQIWVLGWPIPESLGVLGYWFPWMVSSEILHYGYALIMLIGIWILRTGFTGKAYTWWMISFGIQFWHHIEHAMLQGQAIVGENFANSPVPISLVQFVIPRVELHLIYNTLVFIPMIVGMYLHMFPPLGEESHDKCTCAILPKSSVAS